ncbi:damage-inducible protein DinB [Chryseobacterium sp. Leaf180]|uniref:DinB family protein n=1 Tax=Chryseobacterium sp. Leaf180 TaxID=1736289 RepID=UPI0006F60F15|nr:DinB family protein [Chryseobacterium sp. Leaf180]KQR95208.1 damage-inducible protein DinB [Chryseobacterium sp. Leaf180]
MNTLQQLKEELESEYQTTRRFFEVYPEGKNDYAPHPKSMKMAHLATHIAEIIGWPGFMLNSSELDFAKSGMEPKLLTSKDELLKAADDNYNFSKKALENASETDLERDWSLKNDGNILAAWTVYGAIRHSLNQITHHRAQLGIYFRLNEIPLPGSYGPTADNESF